MGHQPYESWLISEIPLLPEEKQSLNEHIASCESCRQLSASWAEIQELFREPSLVKPSVGFTERWQARLTALTLKEIECRQRRAAWNFFAITAGAALLVLLFMVIQYFTTVQTPIQLFISGITLIAGVLNLASAIQVAFLPLINVVLVSVPTFWWLTIMFAACLLTLVLTLSARKFLIPRRVSL